MPAGPRTVSHSAQRLRPPISPSSKGPLESVDPSACLAWPAHAMTPPFTLFLGAGGGKNTGFRALV